MAGLLAGRPVQEREVQRAIGRHVTSEAGGASHPADHVTSPQGGLVGRFTTRLRVPHMVVLLDVTSLARV